MVISIKSTFAVIAVACVLGLTSRPVLAGLGGDVASIESDAAVMKGAMSSLPAAAMNHPSAYSVHTFIAGNGATVREFAAPSGVVFGVAWQGRRPPDLSVVLGSYYPEYLAASAGKHQVDLHRAMITGPNTVVVLSGHMGHLLGRAYVPSLTPSGLDPEAVVK